MSVHLQVHGITYIASNQFTQYTARILRLVPDADSVTKLQFVVHNFTILDTLLGLLEL